MIHGMLNTRRSVRLIAPSIATGNSWIAEDVADRRQFRISHATCAVLALCYEKRSADYVDSFLEKFGLTARAVLRTVSELRAVNLLELDSDQTYESGSREDTVWRIQSLFEGSGAPMSGYYQSICFDYPLADYSVAGGGFRSDIELMRQYSEEQPDVDRFTVLTALSDERALPFPEPSSELSMESAVDSLSSRLHHRSIETDSILRVISLSFGVTGVIRLTRREGAPLLLKTSPSGGARHPTEAYVCLRQGTGRSFTWFHVDACNRRLEFMNSAFSAGETLSSLGVSRLNEERIEGAIVLTSKFSRNMYRYREPRTFRTIHMDIGHLLATVECLAKVEGLETYLGDPDCHDRIENLLRLDATTEGFMASAAFCRIGDT